MRLLLLRTFRSQQSSASAHLEEFSGFTLRFNSFGSRDVLPFPRICIVILAESLLKSQEMRDRLRLRLSAKKRNSAASDSTTTATSRAPHLPHNQPHQQHNVDNHAQMAAGMNYGNWHDMGGKKALIVLSYCRDVGGLHVQRLVNNGQ